MPDFDMSDFDKYIDQQADLTPDDGATAFDDNSGNNNAQELEQSSQQRQDPRVEDAPNNAPRTQNQQTKPQIDPKTGKPVVTQQVDRSQLRPMGDGVFADAKGNIVDHEGKVVAQAGFAARIYNKASRLERENARIQGELTTLQNTRSEFAALDRATRTYGLATEELTQAIDMAGRVKRGDIVGVAKEMVALAVAAGNNVTDILGKDVGDSIDMRAISAMIDQRLGPISQLNEQTRLTAEQAENAKRAYETFIDNNEFAEVHADDIVLIMKQHNLKPQQAYNYLRDWVARNGLDFAQPLGPQFEARQAANPQAQQQQRGSSVPQVKPLPTGAQRSSTHTAQATEMAGADDDWGSIIRSVQQQVQ